MYENMGHFHDTYFDLREIERLNHIDRLKNNILLKLALLYGADNTLPSSYNEKTIQALKLLKKSLET